MDTDYADDLALLTNTQTQAKCLLQSLEQATRGIGLFVNSDKTEFKCFNQDDTFSSLDGEPLKLVILFMRLGCNILSTESNFNICIGKAWTTIDRLMT